MKSKFVLFRLADDEAIYLADLEAGTIQRRESDEMDSKDLSDATGKSLGPAVKGLDFALALSARSTGASHVFFPNR